MMSFTVEETTLMTAFDHSNRSAAIMDMMDKLGMIEDTELKEQVSHLCEKLKTMKDEEFHTVDFLLYEEDEEDEDAQMG